MQTSSRRSPLALAKPPSRT
jgi:hypothetical protein